MKLSNFPVNSSKERVQNEQSLFANLENPFTLAFLTQVLLMGKAKAGKTSMKSIIFADTLRLLFFPKFRIRKNFFVFLLWRQHYLTAKDAHRVGPTSLWKRIIIAQLPNFLVNSCDFQSKSRMQIQDFWEQINSICGIVEGSFVLSENIFFWCFLFFVHSFRQDRFMQTYFESQRDTIFRNGKESACLSPGKSQVKNGKYGFIYCFVFFKCWSINLCFWYGKFS